MIAGRVGERWLGATRNELPAATADIRASGRAERITRFVALCARHETIHPRRQTKSGTRSRGTSKKARAKE